MKTIKKCPSTYKMSLRKAAEFPEIRKVASHYTKVISQISKSNHIALTWVIGLKKVWQEIPQKNTEVTWITRTYLHLFEWIEFCIHRYQLHENMILPMDSEFIHLDIPTSMVSIIQYLESTEKRILSTETHVVLFLKQFDSNLIENLCDEFDIMFFVKLYWEQPEVVHNIPFITETADRWKHAKTAEAKMCMFLQLLFSQGSLEGKQWLFTRCCEMTLMDLSFNTLSNKAIARLEVKPEEEKKGKLLDEQLRSWIASLAGSSWVTDFYKFWKNSELQIRIQYQWVLYNGKKYCVRFVDHDENGNPHYHLNEQGTVSHATYPYIYLNNGLWYWVLDKSTENTVALTFENKFDKLNYKDLPIIKQCSDIWNMFSTFMASMMERYPALKLAKKLLRPMISLYNTVWGSTIDPNTLDQLRGSFLNQPLESVLTLVKHDSQTFWSMLDGSYVFAMNALKTLCPYVFGSVDILPIIDQWLTNVNNITDATPQEKMVMKFFIIVVVMFIVFIWIAIQVKLGWVGYVIAGLIRVVSLAKGAFTDKDIINELIACVLNPFQYMSQYRAMLSQYASFITATANAISPELSAMIKSHIERIIK